MMKNYNKDVIKEALNIKAQEYLDEMKQMLIDKSAVTLYSLANYVLEAEATDNFLGSATFLSAHDMYGITFYYFCRNLEDGAIFYATTDKIDGWMASLEDIKKNYPHVELTIHELVNAA